MRIILKKLSPYKSEEVEVNVRCSEPAEHPPPPQKIIAVNNITQHVEPIFSKKLQEEESLKEAYEETCLQEESIS